VQEPHANAEAFEKFRRPATVCHHRGRPKPVNHRYWPTDLGRIVPCQTDAPEVIMARRVDREFSTDLLPPLLLRIIAAANQAVANSDEYKGHATALTAFGGWALTTVPTRGVLAPSADPDYRAIEAIALRHLNFRAARRAVLNARAVMKGCAGLNDLESAENWACAVSDIAYYYAGVAAGIVLAELATRR
jgi:hypothetical protein